MGTFMDLNKMNPKFKKNNFKNKRVKNKLSIM